jgi:hypothetical protein
LEELLLVSNNYILYFTISFAHINVNYLYIYFLYVGMYTIEFQKRGLPHAHILLWLDSRDKLDSAEAIDYVICAELPDKKFFPKLYSAVCNLMIHGPCGRTCTSSP